jgi:hypothetical protein
MNARKKLVPVTLALAAATLACMINLGGPAYPTPAIPVSTEAVVSLNQGIQQAVAAGAESGIVTLVITEEQLTSYLAFKLQEMGGAFLSDPQVHLREGQIRIYGTATQGYFQVTASLIMTAGVDEQGQLKIELTYADFGPLPAPAELNAVITAIVKEAYTGALGPVATGFRLESVAIANGAMVIVGRTK